jgi:hypothetical protein
MRAIARSLHHWPADGRMDMHARARPTSAARQGLSTTGRSTDLQLCSCSHELCDRPQCTALWRPFGRNVSRVPFHAGGQRQVVALRALYLSLTQIPYACCRCKHSSKWFRIKGGLPPFRLKNRDPPTLSSKALLSLIK